MIITNSKIVSVLPAELLWYKPVRNSVDSSFTKLPRSFRTEKSLEVRPIMIRQLFVAEF